MENWAVEKEFLDRFAEHYETGEKIPADLVERIKASGNFLEGYQTLRQLSFGYLDMAWHTQEQAFDGDVKAFEEAAWKKTQIFPKTEGTCMSTQFGHLFAGGYAAGYYGYKWAEVLDADAFSLFREKGLFNREVATSFRKNILEKGGTEHPMTLYKRFRGKEPTVDALLERGGLK
jgi:peptidyl-dipeptidase Dcp